MHKSNFYVTDTKFEMWGLEATGFPNDNEIINEGWKPVCYWMNGEDSEGSNSRENASGKALEEIFIQLPTTVIL